MADANPALLRGCPSIFIQSRRPSTCSIPDPFLEDREVVCANYSQASDAQPYALGWSLIQNVVDPKAEFTIHIQVIKIRAAYH